MLKLTVELLRKIRYPYLYFKKKVRIKFTSSVSRDSLFEGGNVVGKHCLIRNTSISYGSYLGDNCILNNCKIGRYCSIAYGFKILIGKHPIKTFVSIHPAFYSTYKQAGFTFVKKQLYNDIDYANEKEKISVIIGSDVWIGTDVKINNGVKIGDGAVIGAGSLVLKDVKPFEIVAGVPAKKIGERFTKEEQNMLLEFKWWDYDSKWIKEHSEMFADINKLKGWLKENE